MNHSMKVTFHQLEVFECVARRLSFTRAAEEMGLAQPTVSAQVKQLADEVGMPLFDQIGKTISLTEAGRELLGASRAVFEDWSRFEMKIADLRGMRQGRLRVACVTTAKYFVPEILGQFCAQFPQVEVSLEIANRAALIKRLQENLDDITVMMLPPDELQVEKMPFMDNPLVMIAQRNHPLAAAKALSLGGLTNERFIMREPGSGTRLRAQQMFDAARFHPNIRMELSTNEAIKHAVAAGLGLSVVSRHALHTDPSFDGLSILDVKGFPLGDDWFVVHPRGKRLSVVTQAFQDFLKTSAKSRGTVGIKV
jgi:LysR family transcriptional regulator, low CO2-responsive transcriptional regulator